MGNQIIDSRQFRKMLKPSHLYVIPIGGCGVFGMNMTCYIYNEKLIIVDAGNLFPEPWMPGILSIVPDPDFWLFKEFKLLAYFATHAHEDHIGALPYLLKKVPAPVYSTVWTTEIIKRKLMEHTIDAKVIAVEPGTTVELSPFKLKFLAVPHSIPDTCSFLIKTGNYSVFHSGDFKFDQPLENVPASFEDLKKESIDLFLCDSTNAEKDGVCPEEDTVYSPLKRIIQNSKGNVYLASFSSNFMRFKLVADICQELNKKLFVSGVSLKNNFLLAKSLGIIDENLYQEESGAGEALNQSVILVSGCQGEYRSALARIASDEHRFFRIKNDDLVVFSSRAIPGNEKNISNLIDKLLRLNANVITVKEDPGIHVSGHAYGGEVRKLLEHTLPKVFVPIHGNYRQMLANASRSTTKNILLLENGNIIEQDDSGASIMGKIRIDNMYVDENSGLLLNKSQLIERVKIGKKGVAFLTGLISTGKQHVWAKGPFIRLAGLAQDTRWLNELHGRLKDILKSEQLKNNTDVNSIINIIIETWEYALIQRFGRKPVTYTDVWTSN